MTEVLAMSEKFHLDRMGKYLQKGQENISVNRAGENIGVTEIICKHTPRNSEG